ncbi:MAG: DnaK suppressor protein [Acidimicrobiaceae bacterium]|nr:DnaK suppressor protein [Acidimicrobiaceae bacterium]
MNDGDDETHDRLEARLRSEGDRTEALIGDLRHELASIAESTAAGPDDEHDAEGSTVAYERARVQALLAHAERTAAEIAAAVERVSLAPSGALVCERCGSVIPAERLVALPTTRICVACATDVHRNDGRP